jgi:hypothetical protein
MFGVVKASSLRWRITENKGIENQEGKWILLGIGKALEIKNSPNYNKINFMHERF